MQEKPSLKTRMMDVVFGKVPEGLPVQPVAVQAEPTIAPKPRMPSAQRPLIETPTEHFGRKAMDIIFGPAYGTRHVDALAREKRSAKGSGDHWRDNVRSGEQGAEPGQSRKR